MYRQLKIPIYEKLLEERKPRSNKTIKPTKPGGINEQKKT
jgi:hypothetical protein